jgi:hypothetical protein
VSPIRVCLSYYSLVVRIRVMSISPALCHE